MDARTADLPRTLPVFALSGALLLPGTRLPLTVFEPRYLALVDDALGQGRMFALVQPREDGGGSACDLHGVGTAARMVAFGETGDGRYLITAQGVCRFRVAGEVEGRAGYRRVVADYRPFAADLAPDPAVVDRHRLTNAVGHYLARRGVSVDPAKIEGAEDAELVSALAMAAPLSAAEKQAVLEARDAVERARLMIGLFEMALLTEDEGDATKRGPLH